MKAGHAAPSGRSVLSLQGRQLLAAALGLVAFLSLTGFALDRAFSEAAVSNLRERLQTYAHAYLAGSDLARGGELILPGVPPEPRFSTGGSGLYAAVRSDRFTWESPSAVSRNVPSEMDLAMGEVRFEGPIEKDRTMYSKRK